MTAETVIINKYLRLVAEIDDVVERMRKLYPEEVKCGSGCTECCSAVFYVQLVESISVGMAFRGLPEEVRARVLARCEEIQETHDEIHQRIVQKRTEGPKAAIAELSVQRVPCPLLEDGACLLYKQRPITCRVYGLPTVVDGGILACPESDFKPEKDYRSIDMDEIDQTLREFSQLLFRALTQEYMPTEGILLPISAILLNKEIETGLKSMEADECAENSGDVIVIEKKEDL